MIFTRSSGWLSLSAQLCLKRCKILATSGHQILPFPLLWMPGETLGHRCHRSVRTPYGPSSCKLVQAWSRMLHSAECGAPQVTSFSIQVSLHDDSASLCGANWAHNEGTIGVSTMPKPQSNCNEPCMEVLTFRSTTCWSFTEMSTRFTGRWKLVPLATCQAFPSSCKQLTHWHCEFRECPWILSGKVTHNFRSSSRSPAYLWFFFLLAALQLQHACNCFIFLFYLVPGKAHISV